MGGPDRAESQHWLFPTLWEQGPLNVQNLFRNKIWKRFASGVVTKLFGWWEIWAVVLTLKRSIEMPSEVWNFNPVLNPVSHCMLLGMIYQYPFQSVGIPVEPTLNKLVRISKANVLQIGSQSIGQSSQLLVSCFPSWMGIPFISTLNPVFTGSRMWSC